MNCENFNFKNFLLGPHVVGARYSVFGGTESHPVRVFSVKSSPYDPTVHEGARDFIHVCIRIPHNSQIQLYLNLYSFSFGQKLEFVILQFERSIHVLLQFQLVYLVHFDGMVRHVTLRYCLKVSYHILIDSSSHLVSKL